LLRFRVFKILNGNLRKDQKISLVVIIAITAFVATAATATVFSATPVDAAKPNYCKGNNCVPSQTQCEKRSPGNSGEAQCD
jgi:hypothetical protein